MKKNMMGFGAMRVDMHIEQELSLTVDIGQRIEQLLSIAKEIEAAAAECVASAQDSIGTSLQALSCRLRGLGAAIAADIVANYGKQKQMREALAVSERQFRSLAENLPDNIARWDCSGNYLYVNPTHERTLLKPASELIGTQISEVHGRVAAAIVHVVATGEELSLVRQEVRDDNGEVRVHEVSMIPERDAQGQITSVLGIGRDVTVQVRMQEALAASERKFRTLAENLPNHLARYTIDGRTVYLNPKLETLLGYRTDEVAGRTPTQIFPDGRYAEYESRILETARTGNDSQIELSIVVEDGTQLAHHIDCVAERDDTGAVVSVLVIGHDITQRRRAEVDLRMAASVFQAAGEAIVITDPTGVVLKANPAFTQITDYDFADIDGHNLFELDNAAYAGIQAALEQDGSWLGEISCSRKSGESFIQRLSIAAVNDENADVIQYVCIFSDISQAKRHEAQLEYIAHHDVLTGLANRMLLTARLDEAAEKAHRAGRLLGVLFIDIDGFKSVNDRLGHQVGDQALVQMAQRMIASLRDTDTVARIGGDEFVILLPDLSDVAGCEMSASRLLKAIAEPIDVEGYRFALSASIGIALYPEHGDDADSLLRRADEAMYAAKRNGRSQYVFCSDDSRNGLHLDSSRVYRLRLALEQNQIEVHYQPIVDLATGRVVKAEALARWRDPERGLVLPSEFIPLAEDSGIIHAIGDRVFSLALDVAEAWNKLCPDGGKRRISVNRSPREFLDPDGVDNWIAQLDERGGCIGHMLSVEITENLLLDDRPKVLCQLAKLRSAGMTIAIDDFGTGFSSLAYLKKFAIDDLKIDRSFIVDITDDPSDRTIVESVIVMARHLGLCLIAEGVETEAQASLLTSAGCDYAQGYLYARPMPAKEFLDFVVAAETGALGVVA
ncbi:bifunctional diguanylate cyclase/phosphodiesterase [Caballeronia mineralivorans]|nr:bifunctional diguanylate cyclase/phosphodiesterase [Caballeronia mineralivorans]